MSNKVTLTAEQRTAIDDKVLACIVAGTIRQQAIAAELDAWLRDNMPPRHEHDRFRYVDQSVQRLARAGRIALIGGGHFGWKATGK